MLRSSAALRRLHALRRAISCARQAIQEVETDGCASTVVAHLRAIWGHQRVERVVMLGLGSVSASAPARYQLALGLVLARELLESGTPGCRRVPVWRPVAPNRVDFPERFAGDLPLIYDPIFDAEDVAMLSALSCRVISEGEAEAVREEATACSAVFSYSCLRARR